MNPYANRRQEIEARAIETAQKYLNTFAFFLPVGFVKIAGISITFFLFLIVCYIFISKRIKLFRIQTFSDMLLVLFIGVSFLSLIFAAETFRSRSPIDDFILVIRYGYWLLLALFFKTWWDRFDFDSIVKYFFFGLIATVFLFFTLDSRFELYTQNGFAYTLVASVPIALYYTFKRYSYVTNLFIVAFFVAAALLSQSRAGALLIIMQAGILLAFARPVIRNILIFLFFASIPFTITIATDMETYQADAADMIEPYNEDLAAYLRDPEKVEARDKSLLIRQLMIKKGLSIFEEHPLLGVGLGRFRYYDAEFQIFSIWLHGTHDYYNQKSAHNSYILVLAESGVIALAILLLFEALVIIRGFRLLLQNTLDPMLFFYTSFIGIAIYFYVIASILGSLTWFVFAMGLVIIKGKKR